MRYLKTIVLLYSVLALFMSCSDNEDIKMEPHSLSIRGADISYLPLIRFSGIITRNSDGVPEDMLTTLANAGMNTVRLRVWHNPGDGLSGLHEVKGLVNEIKLKGLKVWLSVHYSDTWADPGHQEIPALWRNIPFQALKDSVYQYTSILMEELDPDYIQIGNEINGGLLWPEGSRQNQHEQFLELLGAGIRAVRDNSTDALIIMHFAGINGATLFFNEIRTLDYDIAGVSYYPLWHGKDLSSLQSSLDNIRRLQDKEVVIAETSYPFTLEWSDWTHNVVGLDEHLILPGFPATPQGQYDFLKRIKEISLLSKALGFCYWGAEWVAHDGAESTEGSSWENQALWGFDFKALPAISVFEEE